MTFHRRIVLTSVVLFAIGLLHSSIFIFARFPTERNARRFVNEFHNKTSNVEIFTRYPHPHETPPPIPGDDFNISMAAPFPVSQDKAEMKVDRLFNELVRILSEGERIKITILTTNHTWFRQEALTCFEHLRKILTEYCDDEYIKNPRTEEYRFVFMNMCNAAWLTTEKAEKTVKDVCEGTRIIRI